MSSRGNLHIQPEHVHTGLWVNYNGNQVTGGQLTMTKEGAERLNIFIGIFLVFAEAGLWGLVTFCLFKFNRRLRKGTTGRPRDGLYHVQQTVLRSGESGLSIATAYLRMWKAWSWKNPKVIMRTWPLILAAVSSSLFFLLAMPFITALSLLENQGDEVLIQSPNCGFWKGEFFTSTDTTTAAIMTNQSREAVSYVDNCYESNIPSSFCDNFLIQRRLPMLQWSAAECPFDVNACLHTNKFPAVEMQTEVLDSHKDFGINAPPNERIKFQRKTVCSPLDVAKFTNVTNGDMPGERISAVYFGSVGSEYTIFSSNYEQFATSAYHLSAVSHYPANGTTAASTFTPIKALSRNDADVSVIFLNNNMIPIQGINGPCKDPFFSATNQSRRVSTDYIFPDSPITAIGCTDQYSFGNPATNQWTKPMAILDTADWGNYTKGWGLTWRQIAAMASITWALNEAGSIDRVIVGLETEALLAQKYPGVFSGFQNPLPNDQWKKEVNYWFSIGLANLQLHLVRMATGPQDVTIPGLKNVLPVLAADKDNLVDLICNSQKVHNDEFRNYHRAGFFAVAIVGGVLIFLTRVYLWFITWYSKESEGILSWTSYSPLQLLRMVLEGAGVEDWRGCDDECPYLVPWTHEAGDLDTTIMDENGKHRPRWGFPGDQKSLLEVQVDAESPGENEGTPLADLHRRGSGQSVAAA